MHLHFNGPKSVFRQDITLQSNWLPIDPSYASDLKSKPRISRVSFGDGYAQRSPDGINSLPLVYEVKFSRRRKEIIEAVIKFLEGRTVIYVREPWEYFWWTPPAPHDQKPLKFVCEQWDLSFDEYNASTLVATFEQVFDPG